MLTISVTLAAFNVEPYVAACLDSILAQSFTDFELIIVDDASRDGTQEILQDYANRDPRIRLFLNDTNAGLAAARNLSITESRGDWITFLDADDLYSPEMLGLAIQAGRQENVEMVLWDYVVFNNTAEIPAKIQNPSTLDKCDPNHHPDLLNLPAFSWTRLVRRDVLERLQIAFPPGLTYQDVPVHWRLVTQLDRIALVPHRLAYYRQQPQATTAGKGIKRADYFIVLDIVEQDLHDSGIFDRYADLLTALQLNAWYGVYNVVAPQHHPQIKTMMSDRMSDRHRNYLKSNKPMRWQARAFFRALDGDWWAAGILRLWLVLRNIYHTLKFGS